MASEISVFENLRTEIQHLGSRITRLSLLLIGALIVVTFTITNGLDKVDLRDVKRELDAAETETQLDGANYLERLAQEKKDQSSAETRDAETERLRDVWHKSFAKQQAVQRKYDGLLKEQFSINPSLLGSSLKIDLRSWVYSIPFAILITFLYVQILRKKQRTLSLVASFQLSNNVDANKLDRLTFSEQPGLATTYARSPSQLEEAIYLLIIVLLVSLIVVDLDATEIPPCSRIPLICLWHFG